METKHDKWPFNGHRVDMQHSAERRTAQDQRIAFIEAAAAAGEVATSPVAAAVVVDIEQFEFRPEDN